MIWFTPGALVLMLTPWYRPGRKDACQLELPPGGVPPGRKEMNPGMFWFSVPSPYNTHEPKLGRENRVDPVFMKTVATSCAGISVYIERITVRSSTSSPSLGKTSLTSIPDFPFFSNLKGEAMATPSMPGIDFPL